MNLRERPVTPDSLRVGTSQHVRKTTTWLRVGTLGQPHRQTINQSFLCHGVAIKTLNSNFTRASLVVNTPWILPHIDAGRVTQSEHNGSFAFRNPPNSLNACIPLLCCHVYIFLIIKYNYKYHSFQWVLWVFLVKYQNWEWFWEPLNLHSVWEVRMILSLLLCRWTLTPCSWCQSWA